MHEFVVILYTWFCDFILMYLFRRGLTDDLGAEAMMFDALEKVEKELKKPLLRNDKKGMSILMAEFDKINQKYDSNLLYFVLPKKFSDLLTDVYVAMLNII